MDYSKESNMPSCERQLDPRSGSDVRMNFEARVRTNNQLHEGTVNNLPVLRCRYSLRLCLCITMECGLEDGGECRGELGWWWEDKEQNADVGLINDFDADIIPNLKDERKAGNLNLVNS